MASGSAEVKASNLLLNIHPYSLDHDPNDPNIDHSGHNHRRRRHDHQDHDPKDPNIDHTGHNHKKRHHGEAV